MSKKFKMSHPRMDDFKAHVQRAFNQALLDRDEKRDRFENSFLYYTCQAPVKDEREVSGYVEPVLRKAVEAVKPSLMNIYTENEKKAVTFRPSALVPSVVSRLVDDYINNLFLRENPGYNIIERVITEALVSGDAFLKFYVEEEVIEEDLELDNVPGESLTQILIEYPDTSEVELAKLTEKDGLISGEIVLTRNEKRVRIEYIPFCDIFVNDDCEDIADTRYLCHRITRSVGDLIAMGFNKDIVEKAGRINKDYDTLSLKSLINSGVLSGGGEDDDAVVDPMEREVYLYEHYIYTSFFNKKGKVELVKAYSTDCDILSVETCQRIPFVHGQVERIPGSFWGVSLYDKHKGAQDLMSRMFRTKEAAAMLNTYNRLIVVKGMYNRESLLNSTRPGAVIEVDQIGAVQPWIQTDMTSAYDSMFAHLQNNSKEDMASSVGVDVTGANMSATAAAITANSADMKDKVIARVLAYTLFKPLFEGIYDIIKEEDVKLGQVPNPAFAAAQEQLASMGEAANDPAIQQQIAMIPQFIDVKGSQLPKVSDFQVDVNTSNDDGVRSNQLIQLASMFTQWSQVPNSIVTPETCLAIAEEVLGVNEEERARFFSVKEPSAEEQQMAAAQQAEQLELASIQKELALSQLQKNTVEIAEVEQRIVEMMEDGAAKRARDEEESMRRFKAQELQEIEMRYEMENPDNKIQASRYSI